MSTLAPRVVRRPVSKTAYYCAGTRMLDAGRPDSLLHDSYAERFMGEEGKAVFARFSHLAVPIGAHQVRCFLIDELVRKQLAANAGTRVILVGAGFDSRAFRLAGGRWLELDDAGLIERKEEIAPSASCANPLTRIGIDFETEALAEKLAPFAADTPVMVICEGVTMYLDPSEIDAMAAALKSHFPRHRLIADIMTRPFADRFARKMSDALASVGAHFRGLEERPLARLERAGYRLVHADSLMGQSLALKRVPIPSIVRGLLWTMPTLRDGYRVAMLEYGGVT